MVSPADTVPQYVRPSECPAVRQCCPSETCGLRTISASQLGTLFGLIAGATLYFVQLSFGSKAARADQHEDVILFEQFWIILLITALYYAIAEWVLEERDYIKLRQLRRAKLEFRVRVFLAIMFGVAVAGAPDILQFGLGPYHISFFLLAIIYLGFLYWDVIVAGDGAPELVRRVVVYDFIGMLLALACLWTHVLYPNVVAFLTFGAFALVMGKLLALFINKDFPLERFRKRALKR